MLDKLQELSKSAQNQITTCSTPVELQQIRSEIIGKKGKLTELLKNLKDISPEQRKEVGEQTNQLKEVILKALDEKHEQLLDSISPVEANFDPTLPGYLPVQGGLHPITQMMYDLNDAFLSLGFEIFEGPEITSELFAFDSMNFPPDHPARESMDTYWLKNYENEAGSKRLCLRPQLTGASVRYMQQHKPPFRFVYPGRVFRNETIDPGHEKTFYQYEALLVDKDIPFSSGQLLISTILDKIFGRHVETRMRTGFFPFVEPGFEIDMRCLVCEGAGCSICKHVGWLEIMPGGAPHPNVLKAGGIDHNEWSGFYINIGLDRLVMMRYGINDIRLFHSADIRFLKQYA